MQSLLGVLGDHHVIVRVLLYLHGRLFFYPRAGTQARPKHAPVSSEPALIACETETGTGTGT